MDRNWGDGQWLKTTLASVGSHIPWVTHINLSFYWNPYTEILSPRWHKYSSQRKGVIHFFGPMAKTLDFYPRFDIWLDCLSWLSSKLKTENSSWPILTQCTCQRSLHVAPSMQPSDTVQGEHCSWRLSSHRPNVQAPVPLRTAREGPLFLWKLHWKASTKVSR